MSSGAQDVLPFVGLVVIGFFAYQFYSVTGNGPRILELNCKSNLTFEKDCDAILSKGAELEVIANPSNNTVFVRIIKNYQLGYVKTAFYLDNCKVSDSRNWQCTPKDSFYNEEIGMIDGKYYSALWSTSPPNYYKSSLYGYRYYLYAMGVIDPFRNTEK